MADADTAPPVEQSAREAVAEGAVLRGWVRDPEGQPIPEAQVRLTDLEEQDLSWEPAWKAGEWGPLERRARTTRTDAQGAFRFALPGEDGEPRTRLLAASASGFSDAALRVDALAAGQEPVRLVLEPAEPVHVLVVEDDGRAIAGAQVSEFGLVSGEEALRRAAGPGTWRRYLAHASETGPDGVATLSRIDGEVVLVAAGEGRRSLPWRGVPSERVTLRLLPSFRLQGLVSLPDWSSLDYEGERRIRVTATRGGIERLLATLRGVEAGPYGPLDLPLLPGALYTVHLEGSPIIPVRSSFQSPVPGGEVTVPLEAKLGKPLWVLVTDMDREPIPDSRVTLKWTFEGKPNHVTRHSDEDGYANMWSLPPVTFAIVASAPGYATEEFSGFEIPEDGGHIPVRLTKAARISGRCFFRGEPVPDFSVTAYADGPARWTTHQFTGREDGSFELDDAPMGKGFVIASTAELPPSEPVAVELGEGEETEVRIELREGWPRSGVVVDAETGEPVPGARIRRRRVARLLAENWWGTDVVAGLDGRFGLEALPEAQTTIEVSAPGYATQLLQVDGGARFEHRPIHVELEHTVSIRLRLTGLPNGSYGGFDASGEGPAGSLPMRWFSADGEVEYADASPGTYRIQVRGDPSARNEVSASVDVHVRPRENPIVPVRVGGANHLVVRLDLDSVPEPHDRFWAQMRYRTPKGFDMILVGPFSEEGLFEVDGIDAASVWVEAIRRSAEPVATGQGAFTDGSLELDLVGGTEPFHLRVVDEDGAPLPAVYVMVVDPATGAYGATGSTGADGTIDLGGVPKRDMWVNLYSKTRGHRTAVPIDGEEGHAEVVLSDAGSLTLRLRHGSAPVTGADARLLTAGNEVYFSGRTSDASGLVTWSKLHPGTFQVRITHPDYWWVQRSFPTAADAHPIDVSLRALGDLVLRAVSPEDAPLANFPLELTDEATGTSVSAWIAAGRVQSPSATTDSQGKRRWTGLPEGAYRVRDTTGRDLGGVEVVGGEAREAVLRVRAD